MKCWFCGGEVGWVGDFEPADIGYDPDEGEGVVAFLTCTNCGAEYEAIYIAKHDPRNEKKGGAENDCNEKTD